MLNVLPLVQGGCVTRPGTRVVEGMQAGDIRTEVVAGALAIRLHYDGTRITTTTRAPDPKPLPFNGSWYRPDTSGRPPTRGERGVVKTIDEDIPDWMTLDDIKFEYSLSRNGRTLVVVLTGPGWSTPFFYSLKVVDDDNPVEGLRNGNVYLTRGIPGLGQGPWSPRAGFRARFAHGFYQGRLLLAWGRFVWFSRTGDFSDFDYTPGEAGNQVLSDDDPIFHELSEDIGTHTIVVGTRLLLFGENKVLYQPDGIVTPNSVDLREAQAVGAQRGVPIFDVRGQAVFVTPSGNDIRSIDYAELRDGYVAPSLSLTGEHLARGIVSMAHQFPDPAIDNVERLWCVNEWGRLAVLLLAPEAQTFAWCELAMSRPAADDGTELPDHGRFTRVWTKNQNTVHAFVQPQDPEGNALGDPVEVVFDASVQTDFATSSGSPDVTSAGNG